MRDTAKAAPGRGVPYVPPFLFNFYEIKREKRKKKAECGPYHGTHGTVLCIQS